MISSRLRRALAAAVLMAAAPASHAWTRISCELGGTVTNLPVQGASTASTARKSRS